MRVLLDECVPRALRKELSGHEVKTVGETGWAGVKNGELLRLAAKEFDLLLTVDPATVPSRYNVILTHVRRTQYSLDSDIEYWVLDGLRRNT